LSVPCWAEPLADQFAAPPASARPWVYWFPLDGNITSNGITADLEAMARVGIGGVLVMETAQGTPKGPVPFASDAWRALFRHACREAARLGLQVNVNNDAGWCGSGGPWITPELSMQRVVWAETNVVGGARFDGALPQPKAEKGYYADIAVLAYPTPESEYRIPRVRGKSAAEREEVPLRAAYPQLPPGAGVARGAIVDLTGRLGDGGRLTWDAPAGRWTLLRVGHTSTGKDNHPAPLEGRGLECDKLSKAAAEAHFNALVGRLIAENRDLAGEKRTLVSTHIDSWEVGSQNWTPTFREDFRRLRGYDLLPLLPVLAGSPVESLEVSERFLWDVRQTVNDLLIENYAGHFRTLAHRSGLRLSIEAYDQPPCDDMAFAGCADEPMSEFWSWPGHIQAGGHRYSSTEMASAAHVYGRPVLGAEAFTAVDDEKWLSHPATLKSQGDWAFCEGVNRFVFHRYAHQPWTQPARAPGMGMGPWGLHYERTQTWWEMSKPWHAYLARCQYLLQQGLFVADLCFLAPENSPQRFSSPVKDGFDRPGYNFDACPPDALLTRMSVRDGRLALPDGMSYAMLVLPQVEVMTPRLLRKVRDLVAAGATALGNPPSRSPSLQGYPACDAEVQALARELWGEGPEPEELTARAAGQGRVIWGRSLRKGPDADYEGTAAFRAARWIWYDEGDPTRAVPPEKRYFRHTVVVGADSPLESARLSLVADNSFECWVNGSRAGAGHSMKRSTSLDLAPWLKPGTNLIAVAVDNAYHAPNPAGLAGALTLTYRGGRTQASSTGRDWEAAKAVSERWATDAGARAGWSAAREVGPLGIAPWGEIEEGAEPADATLDIAVPSGVLERMGVPPDFASACGGAPAGLRYIHKRIGEADVYFVANKDGERREAVATFRVSGKRPELWWPDTGRTEPAAAFEPAGGLTRVPLQLEPLESVFVVFRQPLAGFDPVVALSCDGEPLLPETRAAVAPAARLRGGAEGALMLEAARPGHYALKTASGKSLNAEVSALPAALELAGEWALEFPPSAGAPARVALPALISWSEHADSGVKHFSGTATYRKTFEVPGALLGAGRRVDLDLGAVEVMAEVTLNGQAFEVLWKKPYRLDVTRALKLGQNALEVKVVNLWVNRLIGDEQLADDSPRNKDGRTLKDWPDWLLAGKPSPTGRFTFTSHRLWKRDDPLAPSGLLGPVTLRAAQQVKPTSE
jgi:hypothetical protein